MNLASLFPAALASLTALALAVFAYKWQKELDRRQQQKSEKREAYRLFAQEANSYFARCALGRKMPDGSPYNEHYLRAISATSALIMYAPKAVIEPCQRYSMSLFEFSEFTGWALEREGYKKKSIDRKTLYEKTKRLRKQAMIALRSDLEDASLGDPKEAMDAFFVLTLDE